MKTIIRVTQRLSQRGRTGLYLACLLLISLTACKKEIEPTPVDPGVPTTPTPEGPDMDLSGKVCPVGQPLEIPEVSKTIGPAGGTVSSEDGRIRLDIPAGALQREEIIRIQAISNTNQTGKGIAFQLAPHGTRFAKPVKLSFQYTDQDLNGTVAEALQIAYQNEKGIWMALPGAQLNAPEKTVTIQTTHFSTWSLFSTIVLSPNRKALRPGQTQELVALSVFPYSRDLPPLTNFVDEIPLVEIHDNWTVNVTRWELIGAGKLVPSGAKPTTATYTAPATAARPTQATVTAQIKGKGNQLLLLVSSLMIMPEGLTFRIDKGPWIHCMGTAQQLNGPGQGITMSVGTLPSSGSKLYRIAIMALPFAGTSAVDLNWDQAVFTLSVGEDSFQQYSEHYVLGNTAVRSPGSFYINTLKYSTDSGNQVLKPVEVSGEFLLEKAQLIHPYELTNPVKGTHVIDGYYWFGQP